MKILVCISKAPDTTSKIAFKDNGTVFDDNGIQWIINPYDEWYALVRAVELKEQKPSTTVHLVSVGPSDCEAILRKALSIGGDEAYRIDAVSSDPFYIAAQIASIASQNGYDIILTGKETIDYNGGAMASIIAGILGWDSVGTAKKLIAENDRFILTRDTDEGEATISVPTPLVVGCAKGIAEQRIPNMKGIREARTKQIKTLSPFPVEPLTETIGYETAPPKQSVQLSQ